MPHMDVPMSREAGCRERLTCRMHKCRGRRDAQERLTHMDVPMSRAQAEKCSCIFGISAIHGGQMRRSDYFRVRRSREQ